MSMSEQEHTDMVEKALNEIPGYPFLPCPICHGTEGCDHSVPERAEAWKQPQEKMPTAADLPEGEYAIAEIMGHSTMIGRFAEVERFGTKMLQLEPIWDNTLLPGVFVGGSSLYRFTPCTREVAFARQPKQRYQLPDALRATLPPEVAPALPAPGYAYESELDDEPQYADEGQGILGER